jgi:hypothetical protein
VWIHKKTVNAKKIILFVSKTSLVKVVVLAPIFFGNGKKDQKTRDMNNS